MYKKRIIGLFLVLWLVILGACSNKVTQDDLMKNTWSAQSEEDQDGKFNVEFSKSIMTMTIDASDQETETSNELEELGAEFAKNLLEAFSFKVEYELKGNTIHLTNKNLDLDDDFTVKKDKEKVIFSNENSDKNLILTPKK